jgi:hypothetical protein
LLKKQKKDIDKEEKNKKNSVSNMPRPRATDKFKNIALQFANAVTVQSSSKRCFIAKTGSHSLFSLFYNLFPNVSTWYALDANAVLFTQTHLQACSTIHNRSGISMCEFNKTLIKFGFGNGRARISRIMRYYDTRFV